MEGKNLLKSTLITAVAAATTFAMLPKLEVQAADVINASQITYSAHVQNVGWQGWKKSGQLAGTEGRALRMEAFKLNFTGPKDVTIKYKMHVQDVGWQGWKTAGKTAGTEGKSKRAEAIIFSVEGLDKYGYELQYRAHVQNVGWQSWKTSGQLAGTEGKALRMEALEVRIVKSKDGKALDAAKKAAKSELNGYVNANDYKTNSKALASAIKAGEKAIDNINLENYASAKKPIDAAKSAVTAAKKEAENAIDKIQSDKEIALAKDKTAAAKELDKLADEKEDSKNYTKSIKKIDEIVKKAKQDISAAKDEAAIKKIKEKAVNDINAVETDQAMADKLEQAKKDAKAAVDTYVDEKTALDSAVKTIDELSDQVSGTYKEGIADSIDTKKAEIDAISLDNYDSVEAAISAVNDIRDNAKNSVLSATKDYVNSLLDNIYNDGKAFDTTDLALSDKNYNDIALKIVKAEDEAAVIEAYESVLAEDMREDFAEAKSFAELNKDGLNLKQMTITENGPTRGDKPYGEDSEISKIIVAAEKKIADAETLTDLNKAVKDGNDALLAEMQDYAYYLLDKAYNEGKMAVDGKVMTYEAYEDAQKAIEGATTPEEAIEAYEDAITDPDNRIDLAGMIEDALDNLDRKGLNRDGLDLKEKTITENGPTSGDRTYGEDSILAPIVKNAEEAIKNAKTVEELNTAIEEGNTAILTEMKNYANDLLDKAYNKGKMAVDGKVMTYEAYEDVQKAIEGATTLEEAIEAYEDAIYSDRIDLASMKDEAELDTKGLEYEIGLITVNGPKFVGTGETYGGDQTVAKKVKAAEDAIAAAKTVDELNKAIAEGNAAILAEMQDYAYDLLDDAYNKGEEYLDGKIMTDDAYKKAQAGIEAATKVEEVIDAYENALQLERIDLKKMKEEAKAKLDTEGLELRIDEITAKGQAYNATETYGGDQTVAKKVKAAEDAIAAAKTVDELNKAITEGNAAILAEMQDYAYELLDDAYNEGKAYLDGKIMTDDAYKKAQAEIATADTVRKAIDAYEDAVDTERFDIAKEKETAITKLTEGLTEGIYNQMVETTKDSDKWILVRTTELKSWDANYGTEVEDMTYADIAQIEAAITTVSYRINSAETIKQFNKAVENTKTKVLSATQKSLVRVLNNDIYKKGEPLADGLFLPKASYDEIVEAINKAETAQAAVTAFEAGISGTTSKRVSADEVALDDYKTEAKTSIDTYVNGLEGTYSDEAKAKIADEVTAGKEAVDGIKLAGYNDDLDAAKAAVNQKVEAAKGEIAKVKSNETIAAEEVAQAKVDAIDAINTRVNELKTTYTYETNNAKLESAQQKGIAAVEGAGTTTAVATAKDNAIKTINEVETDQAIALKEAKDTARGQIDTYVEGLEGKYTGEENSQELQNAIKKGNDDITAANTQEEINKAVADAKAAIDLVKSDETIAKEAADKELADAKADAKAALDAWYEANKSLYTINATELQTEITNKKATIDSLTAVDDVNTMVKDIAKTIETVADSEIVNDAKKKAIKALEDESTDRYADVKAVKTAVSEGKTAINAKNTKEDVEAARDEAINAVVKAVRAYVTDELSTIYNGGLNADDGKYMERTTYRKAQSKIDAATTVAEIIDAYDEAIAARA